MWKRSTVSISMKVGLSAPFLQKSPHRSRLIKRSPSIPLVLTLSTGTPQPMSWNSKRCRKILLNTRVRRVCRAWMILILSVFMRLATFQPHLWTRPLSPMIKFFPICCLPT
uniref:DoxX-like family protein n=1 Tax=Ruegeria haliotis TaxID=2747601 RepID=UPI0038B69A1B